MKNKAIHPTDTALFRIFYAFRYRSILYKESNYLIGNLFGSLRFYVKCF